MGELSFGEEANFTVVQPDDSTVSLEYGTDGACTDTGRLADLYTNQLMSEGRCLVCKQVGNVT